MLNYNKLATYLIKSKLIRRLLLSGVQECSKCDKIPLLKNDKSNKYNQFCAKCFFYMLFWFLPKSLMCIFLRCVNNYKSKGDIINDYRTVILTIRAILLGIDKIGYLNPIIPAIPIVVFISPTFKCNQKCKHCWVTRELANTLELSKDSWYSIIDSFSELKIPAVYFTGGEPLIRNDILELITYCTSKGISTFLSTNGTLLDTQFCNTLSSVGCSGVTLSIDGDEITHDLIRNSDGNYKNVLNSIKKLNSNGIRVIVTMTVLKYNLNKINTVFTSMKNSHVDAVVFQAGISSPYMHSKITNDSYLNFEEHKILIEKVIDLNKSGGPIPALYGGPLFAPTLFKSYPTQVLGHLGVMLFSIGGKESAKYINSWKSHIGCMAGRYGIHIDPDGSVTPCGLWREKVGNLRNKRLDEIWIKSSLFQKLRDQSNYVGSCRTCKIFSSCGGCRIRSIKDYSSYLHDDPLCKGKLL